jgi:predicted MFS family arabinose efflux permease
VYAFVDTINVGWGSTTTLLRILGAAALLATFVVIERHRRHPLVPFSIFRLRTLRGANVVAAVIGLSTLSLFYFITQYLQGVLHYSPITTGLAYLPLGFGLFISAAVAGQLVTRIGFKLTLIAGLLTSATALLWFSHASPHGSYVVDVLGPSTLAGIGLGLEFVPVTIAAMAGTRPHEAGLASGLINMSQQIGGALGVAILGTLANSRTEDVLHGGGRDVAAALTTGYDRGSAVSAAFALAGTLLAAVLIATSDSRHHAHAARTVAVAPGAH